MKSSSVLFATIFEPYNNISSREDHFYSEQVNDANTLPLEDFNRYFESSNLPQLSLEELLAKASDKNFFDISFSFWELYLKQTTPYSSFLVLGRKYKMSIKKGDPSIISQFESKISEPERILGYCQQLEKRIAIEKEENKRLCRLLNNMYPAERLLTITGALTFAFGVSLIGTFFFKTTIIHPVLATIGILASASFCFLARWRLNNAK